MSKKNLQRIAVVTLIAALVIVPVLAFFAKESGSEIAYEIPRMLGMEGLEENEVARLDGPPSAGVSNPIFETHGKAVSFDKDLRQLPQTGPKVKKPAREMGTPPNLGPNGNGIDAVLQGLVPLAAPAAAPSSSFKGLDLQNWGAGWPPDTHGDVGPNHYIQAVNTSIGVFDKASGARLAAFTFNNFFVAEGATDACATLNYGDPVVLYDQVSGRWIITDFAFAGSGSTPPYYECIAVSKSGDPVSGGWWLYTVVADTQSLNDYPKLGIWNDGIYMSANMFKRGRSYAGTKVWALNRDDLISGAPLRSVAFQLGNTYFSLLPSNARVNLPPAGTPAYFMSDYGSNTSMKLWKFHVDWANPSASTFTGPTSFNVASFTRPSSRIPQLNSSETVDSLGDRLMTWLQYANINGTESLWVSRTVVSGSSFGIRWMEVRGMNGTPAVYQQGTYAPDSNYRWMPSLAVNSNGDMAVGYSVSSASMYPAIRYAGRLASDPLGTLGQTENTLIAGTGSQSNGYNRWGDYSSMSVDPVDNCTFWFTTEYYETTSNNWQTRIGSFKLADCGGTPIDNPPTVSVTNPSNGATVSGTVNVTANASDDNGVTKVEFFVDGTSIGVDTSAPYAASWNTTSYGDGAHTVSATATDTASQTGSASVNVTVQNTVVDNPPTVSITSPSNGATVSGSVNITANASDDNGVTGVEFFVDGASLGVDTSAPYSVSWDTTSYGDGAHTVSATATDTASQTGSASVNVTVQNTVASGTMHVSAINMSYTSQGPNRTVYTAVTIVDENGAPVAGATIDISLAIPGAGTATGSAITGADGTATFSYKSKNTGTYTATVTNVSHSSYTYDPGANVVNNASITVQ